MPNLLNMRQTSTIELPSPGIGTKHRLIFHDYVPQNSEIHTTDSLEYFKQDRVYIQASLHADELPGMLVNHHLIKLLDAAAARNGILKPITIVPFANPIGLNQNLIGANLMGRFSFLTGVNFNRDWIDVTSKVLESIQDKLSEDSVRNVAIIRKALFDETDKLEFDSIEQIMKKELFKKACGADIVLDLHCDTEAILHMYTHDRLWPELADLSAALESKCNLLAPESGGTPFDEACSCPWALIADKFPQYSIPMACKSVTIELRGENDVCDELASRDAQRLYEFLVRRGYVNDDSVTPTIDVSNEKGSPLSGVDMVKVSKAGVISWKVKAGDYVEEGQVLGEVVDIEDCDAPRVPITSKTRGIVYGIRPFKLAVPGKIVIKVAGDHSLEWRTGQLLTSR